MTLRVDHNHQKGELAYWVGQTYWGKGYATEAAEAMVAFGFETLELNRIHAATLTVNPASSRVMEKAGMRLEGTMKQDLFIEAHSTM